jgi:hypothetical protein
MADLQKIVDDLSNLAVAADLVPIIVRPSD